jgi:CIC family chloride channel protein
MLAIGAMSACLGAVVQAPVTAILIIFEMTHQFALVPGLMIAGLVSLVIARYFNHANFYEEVLLQDGHQMEHIIPPRDLRSWQNLPISAIAQFKPVVVEDLSADALQALLGQHPYRFFPVLKEGRLNGIVARTELEAALLQNREVNIEPAVTCHPGEIIRAMQNRFIETNARFLVLCDPSGEKVLGVVTLHDVLRAQTAMSDRENESGN